ncbi:hypothetical protein CRD60_08295, partial [Bifidobacterium aemilianum]
MGADDGTSVFPSVGGEERTTVLPLATAETPAGAVPPPVPPDGGNHSKPRAGKGKHRWKTVAAVLLAFLIG